MNNLVAWLNGKKTIIGIVLTFILLMLPYLAIPQVHAILVTYAMFYQIALKMSAGLIGVGVWHKLVKLTNLLGGAADVDKPDPAGEGAQSGSPASSDPGTVAKLLIVGLAITSLLSFGMVERSRASELIQPAITADSPGVYLSWGKLSLVAPLRVVDLAPYIKVISASKDMPGAPFNAVGAQTSLAAWPTSPVPYSILGKQMVIPYDFLTLSFGGVTSFQANGMPYASVMAKLWFVSTPDGTQIMEVGGGYGHDFKANQDYWLLLATTPIGDVWDAIVIGIFGK